MKMNKTRPVPEGTGYSVSKNSSSFLGSEMTESDKIFGRDLCLDENTLQAASVEFVPLWGDKLCAQQTAKTCRKAPKGGFDNLKARAERHGPVFIHFPESEPGTPADFAGSCHS